MGSCLVCLPNCLLQHSVESSHVNNTLRSLCCEKIAGQGNTSQVCCGIWKSRWLSYRRTDSFLKILEKQETWDCGLLNPPEQLDQSWPWLRAGFSPSKHALLRNFVNNFVSLIFFACMLNCMFSKKTFEILSQRLAIFVGSFWCQQIGLL